MKPYNIRPATADDIMTFYGHMPPRTIKAFAVEYGGRVAAIAGVTIEHLGAAAFSDISPDIDAPKLTRWRAARELIGLIKSQGGTIYVSANRNIPNSERFLKRLGFTFFGKHNNEAFYRLNTWHH